MTRKDALIHIVAAQFPTALRSGGDGPESLVTMVENAEAALAEINKVCGEPGEDYVPADAAQGVQMSAEKEHADEARRLRAINADLLAALEAFVSRYDGRTTDAHFRTPNPDPPRIAAARAAIKKAKGGS